MKARAITPAALTAAAIFSLAAVLPARAETEESDAAELSREQFERGIILYKAKDHKGALECFEKAYALKPHYKIKYNIGICLYALGHLAKAANELEDFLSLSGGSIEKKALSQVQQIFDDVVGKIGTLVFEVDAEGVVLVVDGTAFGEAPIRKTVYVEPGKHTVRALSPDGKTWEGKTSLSAGEKKVITVLFEKTGGAGKIAQPEPELPTDVSAAAHETKKPLSVAWFGAAAGLALALAAAGTATGIVAMKKTSKIDELDKACAAELCDLDPTAHESYVGKRKETYDDALAAGHGSTGLFVGAGVLAAAAVVLAVFTWRPPKREKKAKTAFFPLVTGGLPGAGLEVEF